MTIEPRVSVIKRRLADVDHIIAVASGKGGVGKSMVAANLALALKQKGYSVGLLDLDLYGPSSHIILGVQPQGFPDEDKGIIPPDVHDVAFMSIVLFSEDKPAPFRGDDISNIIMELLAITRWGALDYLIIDMPPGIGDETLDVINLIKRGNFLVVTTPSKVALGAVGKLLGLLTELKLPVAGVLENMVMKPSHLVEDFVSQQGITYLGAISYDDTLETAVGDPEKLAKQTFMKDLDAIIDKHLV